MSYCDHISEAGIELLGQTHCLTSLDLSGCNCGDVVSGSGKFVHVLFKVMWNYHVQLSLDFAKMFEDEKEF